MMVWLAMLVHHGYVKEIHLSFLLVGHTHEDIDQLFSVLSRCVSHVSPPALWHQPCGTL